MPRSATCNYNGKTITVDEALDLKGSGVDGFYCLSCGQPVNPHSASSPGKRPMAAHFEHPASGGGWNEACPFSDQSRKKRKASSLA